MVEKSAREAAQKSIAENRKAFHDYYVLETFEAGVALLGTEEQTALRPAVADCRQDGIDVAGPYPADSVFVRAVKGEFDAVIACYHDQGLIPVKLVAFGHAVNVTLGLPIIRTSVDHGTAFDIAGRGVADAESMVQAVLLAAKLSAAAR